MGTWLRIVAFLVIPLGVLIGAAELILAFALRQAARRIEIVTHSEFAAALTLIVTTAVVVATTVYAAMQWMRFIKPFIAG